jgi:hypothetical protein
MYQKPEPPPDRAASPAKPWMGGGITGSRVRVYTPRIQ